MKNPRLFYAFVTTVALAGCGGSSDSRSNPSPFSGPYIGTYVSSDVENDDNGSLSITVESDGTINGTFEDSRYGDNGIVGENSRIERDGEVVVNVGFAGVGGGPVQTTTFRGTLTKGVATLTGTLDEQQGDFNVPFTFTLNRFLN